MWCPSGHLLVMFSLFCPPYVFILFYLLRIISVEGGRGAIHCQTLSSCSFFFCSADHTQDWPPCKKVVFFGLATSLSNVRNNNSIYIWYAISGEGEKTIASQ